VLRYRLITGPLLILVIVLVVWLDSVMERVQLTRPWGLDAADAAGLGDGTVPKGLVIFCLALLVVPVMAHETSRMLGSVGVASSRRLAMVAATVTYIVTALLPYFHSAKVATAVACTLALFLVVAGLLRFSRGHNVHGVMAAIGGLLLVAVYAGVLITFWLLIRHDHSPWILVGAILTTKSCDIGAYFTGRAIGRHKLIEWLSPKKTWEGLAGGVVTAALVGTALALLSARLEHPVDHLPWWVGALGGVLVGIVGQFGDLAESMFKRDAGMKDSGTILPGMGGVLDVLDSPLMTGPVVYWLLACTAAAS